MSRVHFACYFDCVGQYMFPPSCHLIINICIGIFPPASSSVRDIFCDNVYRLLELFYTMFREDGRVTCRMVEEGGLARIGDERYDPLKRNKKRRSDRLLSPEVRTSSLCLFFTVSLILHLASL